MKADFHSVEFSDWTGSLLFKCENVALNLKRMLHLTNSTEWKLAFREGNSNFLKSVFKALDQNVKAKMGIKAENLSQRVFCLTLTV